MVTVTANGKYTYDQKFFGVELKNYITQTHKDLSDSSGWKYFPLKLGSFGYDNQAHSVGHALSNYKENTSLEEMATLVHDGWTINYLYWRDNKPWTDNKEYLPPASPLGDERRNKCAATSFKDLSKEEQAKDIIIAKSILEIIKQNSNS